MMNFNLPIPVQLMLRRSGNKTMIIGVCDHGLDIPDDGVIVVGHTLIIPDGVYDTSGIDPKRRRADQILTSGVRICDCKRLDI